jgi:hypothetical protein
MPRCYFENESFEREYIMGIRYQKKSKDDYLKELKNRLEIILKNKESFDLLKGIDNQLISILNLFLINCRIEYL